MQNPGSNVFLVQYFLPKYLDKWTTVSDYIYAILFWVNLTHQYIEFVSILSNMRRGFVTPGDSEKLKALSRKLVYEDGIEPSELYFLSLWSYSRDCHLIISSFRFPLKNDVEVCNQSRLSALPGPEYVYYGMDSAGYDVAGFPIARQDAQKLLERVGTPAGMTLKV